MDEIEQDNSFLENSLLYLLLPQVTDFRIEDELRRISGNSTRNPTLSVPRRELLFYDETITLYPVLRISGIPRSRVDSYLKRLVIYIEVFMHSAVAHERDGPAAREVAFAGQIEDVEKPLVIVSGPEKRSPETDGGLTAFVAWKQDVAILRPRIRMQDPGVDFTVTGTLRPADANGGGAAGGGYLPSGIPAAYNLLEPFSIDSALGGVVPRLPASRVSRVAPLTQASQGAGRIKAVEDPILKVYAAMHTRIKFARPNTTPTKPFLIALLEVDFTPYFDFRIDLESINLSINHGTVEDINGADGLAFPLHCVAHDHVTFMWRLTRGDIDTLPRDATRELEISVKATVHLEEQLCLPRLSMTWTATPDFTLPVNPGFGAVALQPPIQRGHRPSQLSITGNESLTAPAVSRPDSLPSLEATTRPETIIPDFGITMTVTGPPHPVPVGEIFSWHVFVVNRSADAQAGQASGLALAAPSIAGAGARKLAITAVPKRRRNEMRVTRPPSMGHGGALSMSRKRDELVADAVLDANIVHAMQRSSLVDSTEVVCLTPESRVGPLAPNTCHVVELKFLPLQCGIVGIEALRIIDLASQEHVDVRDLPDMFIKG